MIDPRVTKLAELLCTHSTELSEQDAVLIHAFDIPEEVVAEVVRVAQSKRARVAVRWESNLVRAQLMRGMTEANAKTIAQIEKAEMDQMTAYISIRGSNNYAELSDIDPGVQAMWQRVYSTPVVFETRIPKTKWVALRWPNSSMAQQANMPTMKFEDFYFRVVTVDYPKMRKDCEPLQELMSKTAKVKIVGPGTDFEFSIRDIGAVSCWGQRNIPDGECFSCPIKDSANGTVQYNTVSLYQGNEFSDIRLTIKNGRIVEACAGDMTDKMNEILDTDEGARYFGEWSLGFNPQIMHPMKDTLFDEKIAGSFHLTPGNAYEGAGGNGNKSAIHWDIVCIQRAEYGGGEIYFDDKLVRKDGQFVLPDLMGLNY